MEDAPPKPDPAPILLAIKRFSVRPEKLIMVGDTVDDILAARAAGTAAIGVLTPSGYAQMIASGTKLGTTNKLMSVGANSVILPGLGGLLDIVQPLNMPVSLCTGNREGSVARKTLETSIEAKINIDGTGKHEVSYAW